MPSSRALLAAARTPPLVRSTLGYKAGDHGNFWDSASSRGDGRDVFGGVDAKEIALGDRLWRANFEAGFPAQFLSNKCELSYRHHMIANGRGKAGIVVEAQVHGRPERTGIPRTIIYGS